MVLSKPSGSLGASWYFSNKKSPLDASDDATVDINEFIVFVAAIPSACHVYFRQKALTGCPTDPGS